MTTFWRRLVKGAVSLLLALVFGVAAWFNAGEASELPRLPRVEEAPAYFEVYDCTGELNAVAWVTRHDLFLVSDEQLRRKPRLAMRAFEARRDARESDRAFRVRGAPGPDSPCTST